jgi:predicted nucleic acid-binding protein
VKSGRKAMHVMIDTNVLDIFITGDKDFDGLDLKRPKILSPAGFLEKY